MKTHFYLRFLGFCLMFCLIGLTGFLLGCSDNSPVLDLDGGTELINPDPDDDPGGEEEGSNPGGEEEEAGDPELEQGAKFVSGKFVSETEIVFEFSAPVTLVSLSFDPEMDYESVEEEGSTVTVVLEKELGPGIRFMAILDLEDDWDNAIREEVSIISWNNRFPSLLINELRIVYINQRQEFIELKMLSDGNLGGLQVFVASNSQDQMIYEFKPVEVKKGEYVVLHLRKLEDTCVDEYGDSLNESVGKESNPNARDIWIHSNKKLIDKTDAVYVMDMNERVLDAVMFSDNPASQWSGDLLKAAEFLFEKGAWSSSDGEIGTPADAVDSSASTTTRTINRDETVENSNSAADWFVTVNSGNTPGKENDLRRFQN